MPDKTHQAHDSTERLRTALLRGAVEAATDTLEKHTALRGGDAQRVARYTVTAVAPKLRAECVAKLAGVSHREATALFAAALGLFTANVAVLYQVARHGSRTTRLLAAAATAGHVGMVAYSNLRDRQLRGQARREMAASTKQAGRKPGAV